LRCNDELHGMESTSKYNSVHISNNMGILRLLKQFFNSTKKSIEIENSTEGELCIVGNIVNKHFYGEHKEIRRGTKHFRPNAKVYCLPEYGGMGHETMVVLGIPRKTRRFIKIAIPTKRIKNFRIKTVYKPLAIGYIRENWFYEGWRKEKPKVKDVQEFVNYLNALTEEID